MKIKEIIICVHLNCLAIKYTTTLSDCVIRTPEVDKMYLSFTKFLPLQFASTPASWPLPSISLHSSSVHLTNLIITILTYSHHSLTIWINLNLPNFNFFGQNRCVKSILRKIIIIINWLFLLLGQILCNILRESHIGKVRERCWVYNRWSTP